MSAIVSPARKASNNPSESSQAGNVVGCPAGLLYLLGAGTGWLALALALGFLNSLRFHVPGLLAGCAFLTYGRVHAAQESALLYGFGVQAALGVGLWLLCRLGKTALAGPFVVFLGALLWNTAVTLGILAILCGDNTGYAAFEMPAICAPMLFTAYALIGICGMLTFHKRQEGLLYPSQWFVVGSLFWFPWIFSTAALLLLYMPVNGVLQASIAWWYAHNLSTVFLGFAGLASSFYFIPKLLGRPLHSRQLAALAFWTLAIFGSWGGIPDGAPLPSWISSLGVAGTVLTAVPMIAIAANFLQTARQNLNTLDANPTLRFTYVGLLFLLIAAAQQIVGALPQVSAITSLTWFGVAQKELFHLGFFAMTMFGAIYYIVPRLLGFDATAWCPKLEKAHFYLTFIGVLISYLALLVAGVGQGILLSDSGHSFVQAMQGTLMPLRLSTLGDLMLLAGTLVFLANFARVVGNLVLPMLFRNAEGGQMNNGPLLFLGLFAAMACSWLGFVMEPQVQIGNLPQTNTVVVGDAISQTYPLAPSGDAHQGAEVYRANGCAACHTQMVRPQALGPDISHGWGARRSVAEDYLFDRPVLLGSQRIGPDLSNFGRRSDINGILIRLYNPRILVPGSVMPGYPFLFETRQIEGASSTNALVLPEQSAPPPGYEVVPRPEARALAAYLLGLRQDGYLFEAPPPPLPKTNSAPAAAVKK